MFGGYGIFHEGLMFSLIAEDTLYFKVNDSNRDIYEKAESKSFSEETLLKTAYAYQQATDWHKRRPKI